eukprot:CAMPEP_0203824170 /NCGR_PEP_ID=MMETSP0115-20131106/51151_1 /ASSEMBLY_ACC=CAM_ASM_000227 /TAXON_ID=33651 /ORGANISM="Bicosoecid sp, Strain ms1" /LENGTH=236 /DNA_ID=CAMNT_0050733209 /DNA_START=201 /DNA_END=908 /DNA_ORIENTATION=-
MSESATVAADAVEEGSLAVANGTMRDCETQGSDDATSEAAAPMEAVTAAAAPGPGGVEGGAAGGAEAEEHDPFAAAHYRSPLLESTLREALPSVHMGRPVPSVSAKAWAVLDAATGRVVWGSQHNEARRIASLTKIVTASVVVDIAKDDPGVLHEIVDVSAFAARTIGTSARLRAGDRVAVKDLLHGLMLPSGNDAAQALSEHFGRRLLRGSGGDAAAPVAADDREGGEDGEDGAE